MVRTAENPPVTPDEILHCFVAAILVRQCRKEQMDKTNKSRRQEEIP